jgi:hypothetical protein
LPHRSIAKAGRIKENKTRSLIKSSYLSKTNLPKSNKRKEKHNKINQNQITFKIGAQRYPELQAPTSRVTWPHTPNVPCNQIGILPFFDLRLLSGIGQISNCGDDSYSYNVHRLWRKTSR